MQPFKPQSESVLASAPHGHEEGDVAVNGILVFLAVLAASCLLVFVLCYGMRFLLVKYYITYTDPKPNYWQAQEEKRIEDARAKTLENLPKDKPVPNEEALSQQEMDQLVTGRSVNGEAAGQGFPNPRLQTDTGDGAEDLQKMRKQEDDRLNNYMWLDKQSGRVTLPIDDAIREIAHKGLPSTGATSTPPPSTGGRP